MSGIVNNNQNHFRTDFDYDANCNITQLQRNRNNTLIDNLSYSYYSNGNRLKSVTDASGNTAGYAPNTGQYLYDANANMTYDPSKKITVSYNPLNLPSLVEFDNSDFIEYTYSASGTKLRKTVSSWKTTTGGTTDYAGQFLYQDNELSCIFTPVGRIVPMQYNDETFWKHEYNLKDHLGNTRIVFAAHPHGQPELMQQTSYYPFGMTLQQQNFGGALNPPNKLLYNGKELQDDELAGLSLDWYDYGARMYDAQLGRWHVVDPMASEAPGWTPYRAFYNNPIYFIDPTGLLESTHTDEDGNVIAVYDDGDHGVYKHANGTTKEDLDSRHGSLALQNPTGAGGERMGETEHWDEFVSPETGETMTNYRIQFGKSFDPIIDRMNEKAQGMDLKEIAAESGPGGDFDIKVPYKNVGALLNRKYATSRSAGNYLAGYNAQGGTYFGVSISFDTFQKLAGGLHVKGSLSNAEKANIVLLGKSYGPPPAYGEVMYQYRMSKAGWDKAKLNNK